MVKMCTMLVAFGDIYFEFWPFKEYRTVSMRKYWPSANQILHSAATLAKATQENPLQIDKIIVFQCY